MPTDSLTLRVINFIFDHIRRNQLSSGEKLPSELKTSTELNVSRGVVREAFRSLEVAGIIEKENGRSPKVGVLNSLFLTHLMMHAILTRQVSIKQVLELRASIEVNSAEQAARRHTRSDVQRLRIAVEGMKQSVTRFSSFVKHDLDFHQVINSATGNPLIEVVCSAMHESIKESMLVGLRKRNGREEIEKVAAAHEAIAEAIEKGNAAQARVRMRRHFEEPLRIFARLHED
jgi:GntR family transcriptional regulator, transcriptional repressor for pyruvate dehydrogenase complex